MAGAVAAATTRAKVGTWVLSALHRNPGSSPRPPRRSTRSAAAGSSSGWVRGTRGPGRPTPSGCRSTRSSPASRRRSRSSSRCSASGRADFEGTLHAARELVQRPVGPRPIGIPLMIGGNGPKGQRHAVRHADIYSCYIEERASVDEVAPRLASLEAICAELGRDPASIGRSIGMSWTRSSRGASRRGLSGSAATDRRSARVVPGRGLHAGRADAQGGHARGLDAWRPSWSSSGRAEYGPAAIGGYNSGTPETVPRRTRRCPGGTRPMATTAAPGSDRTHAAAKRYIYAWGGGRAEGDATMRDLLGGKGAGLAEMTKAGLPMPPGFTITTEACNDYFANGEQLPGRPLGGRPRGRQAGRARDRQGLRRRGEPAARERPLRRQVLDARHDGHGPQPRPQRGDAPGPGRAHRQRALRLGRLPAVHPDVRAHRHGRARRALRPRARREEGRARGRAGHRPHRRGPARGRRRVQGDRPRGHRPRLPDGPVRAARPRDQGRVRVAGSASARSTTATARRSRTTSARP